MADDKEDAPESPDVHFEPLVNLPPVDIKTMEEDEEELIKLRARLYRYDVTTEPGEWKERGTGDVKLLRHKERSSCRLLMRRDKTLKICGNHYILPAMNLKPNCGSDRVWVWSTPADFADEEPKPELLAIRFANAENAQKFYDKFEEAKKIMETFDEESKSPTKTPEKEEESEKKETEKEEESEKKETEKVAEKLAAMSVKDNEKTAAASESTEKETDKEAER